MKNDSNRIDEIIERLESLQLEMSSLTTELRTLRSPVRVPAERVISNGFASNVSDTQSQDSDASPFAHGIKEGDKVIIVNNYRGQRGTIGVAAVVNATWVTLIDDSGNIYKQKYHNLRLI